MRRITIGIVALALLTFALPSATAQSAYVAGGCNDDGNADGGLGAPDPGVRATDHTDTDAGDSNGEEADTGADADSEDVDVVDAVDAANAVLYLVQGALWDGQGPSNNCDAGGWVGVFTSAGDVCYDGDLHVGSAGGSCATHDGAGGDNLDPVADDDS